MSTILTWLKHNWPTIAVLLGTLATSYTPQINALLGAHPNAAKVILVVATYIVHNLKAPPSSPFIQQ